MNIAHIINDIANNLDCGLCWKPFFGGREDYLNLAKSNGECCAIIGAIDVRSRHVFTNSVAGSYKNYSEYNLKLFAGHESRIDIQFYNEVDPDKIDESKWEKYLFPIKCCIDEVPKLFCVAHNCSGVLGSVEVTKFDYRMVLNFLDNNYDGWEIDITIRHYDRS